LNPPENLAQQSRVRSRQETINKRMKDWKILRDMYCHVRLMHGDVFRAIAVITQLEIENGNPLFQVEYDDDL
jgi:hypothetical protein